MGAVVAGVFESQWFPPLELTVLGLAALGLVGGLTVRTSELSPLPRLFILLYLTPFSVMAGYLWNPNFVWITAPNCTALCQNRVLINQMLLIATAGLCGLMAGFDAVPLAWRRGLGRIPDEAPTRRPRTLSLPVAITTVLAAVMLSWLHAPARTIFSAPYTAGISTDLRAAYLISYLLLILMSVDAERDVFGSRSRKIKTRVLAVAVTFIVGILQFLRGDRESAGLVLGLAILYVTGAGVGLVRGRSASPFAARDRARQLVLPLGGCLLAMMFLGSLRHIASPRFLDPSTGRQLVHEYLTRNTWTAVARNNLGLATDYHYGTLEYLNGRTYVDYLRSLVPYTLAVKVGYLRPLDGPANPAEWYKCLVSNGGMHPAVVPFRNFGIVGVIAVLFLAGAGICACEVWNESGRPAARLLYGSIATSSALWFWYGDMNLVRALMVWAVMSLLYQSLIRLRGRTRISFARRSMSREKRNAKVLACMEPA